MTLNEIARVVKKVQGISPRTKKRQRVCILAKYTYHSLARKYTTNSLAYIGKIVGVDHATVLNGLKKIDGLLETYPEFKPLYKECERIVILNSSKKDVINYAGLKKAFFKQEKASKTKVVYEKLDIRKCERLILNSLSNLSDGDVLDFEETRLKPYLSMLKSRRVHKTITEVKGALLRN